MLAWYRPEALDHIPGRLSLDPAAESSDDVAFRDDGGSWWRPQRDGSWIHRDPDGWRRAPRPESLEGMTPLPLGIVAIRASAPIEERDEAPEDTGAPAGLARCVDRTCRSYRAGEMVSTMAELILSDWKLLTADGRLWTVGARSRSWYAYGEHGWERIDGPPASPFVSGAEAGAIFRETGSFARRWAEQGPLLPERIAPEWAVPEPPEAFVPPAPESPPLPPIDELPPE